MNAEPKFEEAFEAGPLQTGMLRTAYGRLQPFVDRLAKLEDAVEALGNAGGDQGQSAARKLKRQIREFEPSITMIGQVKAGKTTLVNALVGWPGILPADVNPWTSVVTSLHADPKTRCAANKANFGFFGEEEWNRLLNRGGRVGELASRAGAHKELEKVRRQLEAMRQKSKDRLGRKFELLMGQEHEYGYFDEELIQRYVCLGDDMGDEFGDPQQGRFADITKSADLYFGQPELPHRLCFRDTPGVNDTFMIREQITVNAIRDSRLCVVVLSAHQTLSTVDMALIRLISNIKSREVIIFVNRIDELGDPVNDTREIRKSILATLKEQGGPEKVEIVFGSAFWATHSLAGTYDKLGQASGDALVKWAEAKISEEGAAEDVQNTIWQLSGVPKLCDAIARRVRSGEGAEFEDRAVRAARNIANGLTAAQNVVSRRLSGGPVKPVARQAIGEEVDSVGRKNLDRLDENLDALLSDLVKRLDSSRKSFLGRATASLIKHLEKYGDDEVWTYDPSGLRLLLRSGYQVFVKKAEKSCQQVFLQATSDIRDIYIGAFELPEVSVALNAPVVPPAPAPVILGSTIALDVRGNWWTNWWRRRRSYGAFAEEFAEMIDAELEPFVTSLRAEHAETYVERISATLEEFIEAQKTHLVDLADQTDIGVDELRTRVGQAGQERWETLKSSVSILSEMNATLEDEVES